MRRLIRPALFTAMSAAATIGFLAVGGSSPAPVTWGDLAGWLDTAEPVDAFAEMARWIGLALASYVLVVSFTALLAELADVIRMPRLHRWLRRAVGRVALPALRHRLLEVTTVATITASSLQAAPAGAQSAAEPTAALILDQVAAGEPAGVPGEHQGFGVTTLRSPNRSTASSHTVQPGDTLWDIVETHFGHVNGSMINAVVAANPVIDDPDLIRVGWVIELPDIAGEPLDERPPVAGDATWTVVTVRPGDTLWDIVDAHFGGATAELVWATVEANPAIEDPALIFPGQLITLPPPGGDVNPKEPPREVSQPPVEPPPLTPTPPLLPKAESEPATAPSAVPTTSDQRTVPPPTPVAPSTPAAAPTVPSVTHEQPERGAVPADVDIETETDDEVGPSVAQTIGWTGGAGLAAALLGLAARRRRRRPPRERYSPPSEPAVHLGVALRETEQLDLVEWAAVALTDLAGQIRPRPGEPTSVPRMLRLAGDEIELVWDVPNPDVVEPWHTNDGGWSWTIDRPEELRRSDASSPCPGFVTIGRRDGADVLLNLESCGVIAVDGDPKAVLALVRSIALELAASTFSDSSTVLLVGASSLPGEPEHARVVGADEALGWMRDRSDSATALLAHRRLTSLFALRARSRPQDSHEPVIVIVDPAVVEEEQLDQMLDLANGDLGTILVIAGTCEAATWKLGCKQDEVDVQPLGLKLTSRAIAAESECVIEAMVPPVNPAQDELAEAEAYEPDEVEAVLADHVAIARDRLPDIPVEADEAEWDVELKVLGQVRCLGAEQPLTPTELHLAIYLAFHPNGENSDTVATMVWPNGVAHRTLTNTMASLRRKLGTGSDGEMLFPLGRDSQYLYKLSPGVTTDWHRFLELVRRAETVSDDQAVDLLDDALSLIEGPPFRAAAGYSWAYSDGTASLITETVALAARRCADLHHARGEALDAEWASHRGRQLTDDAPDQRPLRPAPGILRSDS